MLASTPMVYDGYFFHSYLVQNGDIHKEHFSKSSSRSLLYSWDDDDDSTHEYVKINNFDHSETALYVVLIVVVCFIAICCRICQKSCKDEESNTYSDTVLHSPPRSSAIVAPPPTRYGYGGTSGYSGNTSGYSGGTSGYSGSTSGFSGGTSGFSGGTSGSSLAPPRTSRSIILPLEGDTFPAHLYGIDNPNYQQDNTISEQYHNYQPANTIAEEYSNYQPANTISEQYTNYQPANSILDQYYPPMSQNQTPMSDILDMPPSYDAVVKEEIKYPKPTKK